MPGFFIRIILILVISCVQIYALPAPDFHEFSISHITTESGLSNKTVLAVVQDKEGYMWFGTESGLNRFDGYAYKIFRNDPDDPCTLPCNRISSLLIDRAGVLWVGTNGGGLCRYRRGTEDFERISLAPDDPESKSNIILALLETGDGYIWVGTWGEGLVRIKPGTGDIRKFKPVPNEDFHFSNRILTLHEDDESILWAGTRDGLFIFNRGKETFSKFRLRGEPGRMVSVHAVYKESSGKIWVGTYHGLFQALREGREIVQPRTPWAGVFENTRVYRILEDRYHRLWIGSWAGLFEINKARDNYKEYSDSGIPDMVLTSSIVLDIVIDRAGVFWVGTISGLNYFNSFRSGFRNWDMRENKSAPSNPCYFSSVYGDEEGYLWLGTLKEGVIRCNRSTGKCSNIRKGDDAERSLKSNVVMNICGNGKGKIYIGTTGGFSILDVKSGRITSYVNDPGDVHTLSNNEVINILEYSPDEIILGTMKGLNLLNVRTGKCRRFLNVPSDPLSISADLISSVTKDRNGRVWVGTYGGGLNLFHPESGKFEQIIESPESGIRRNFIYPAVLASDGNLWMGSNEGGLKMFDPEQRVFRNFSTEDGLPSNTVWDVLEDGDGNLWLSTQEGIARVDRRDFSVTSFNQQDGVMINSFNFNSAFRGSDGEMFFSGENGFLSFFPDRIKKISFNPPVAISSVRKYNDDGEIMFTGSSITDSFELNHQDRVVTFEFSSLSFLNPRKNQYRYKLEGLNNEWVDIGSDRSVTFGHLPPGKYTFKVAGSNCYGDWNNHAALVSFVMQPAFWQTWWFTTLLFLLLATGSILFYRYKVGVIEKRVRDESEMEKLFRKKKISKREREILMLVIQGLTSREIEDKLFISYGTVKNHIYNIYKKLNVKNRAEIVNLFKDIKNL